ncbi:MAG: Fe-S cluster assembly protein SufD [Aquiluna sp.]|jgi:Fe-S cluster assembly protein SufD|nr:Fe-S cluster assembly protein SufD [Aquiluna sp.]MDG2478529.1 Fe-S cluster assembly protein SufD [Aquiluna sp.]
MAQHGIEEHSHGLVPLQTRSERPRSTTIGDFAEISNRQEIWRYLPLDQLNGLADEVMAEVVDQEISSQLAQGVTATWVNTTEEFVGTAGLPEDRISAIAWTNASKTLLIDVPANAEISDPSFLTAKLANSDAKALHVFVRVGANAKATIVLDHVGLGVLAENVEILLDQGAKLDFVTIQDWAKGSSHVSTQFARLGRDSFLKHVVVSLGGDLVRITPSVALDSPGAEIQMFGVYLADSGNYFEHRPYVDHIAANCISNVAYKGALQGAGAHTVWVGDVLIRQTAIGTNSYELNRNLLLTDGARADSVPNLEIETGKIEGAGHASASGRFDDEQLFYLMARGIGDSEAKKLVVRGFLNEVVQKIGIAEVEQRLIETIEQELEKVGA